MKVQNAQLINCTQALNILNGNRLPLRTMMAIVKNTKQIESARADIEACRQKLMKEHCELDENGELVVDDQGQATPIDREAFDSDYKELIMMESEVDIQKIGLDDLGSVEMSAAELMAIDFMLNEDI